MHPLLSKLLEDAPIVTDGAWGTELQSRALPVGAAPDEWNLSHPEQVEAVARAYVQAGSKVILTNTFGANRIRLSECGVTALVTEINRRGVEISRAAAADRALVFASIGPSGKMLLTGDVSADDLRSSFEEQATALAFAGADGIVIETMTDLDEAVIAVAAAKMTTLPVVACMVFDSGKHDHTMMGVTPEQAADALGAAGADIIGANCGAGIESFSVVCHRLHAASQRPVWVKPNAGLPEIVKDRVVYRTDPGAFALQAVRLSEMGAGFIGGCCGTNPDFIRAIRQQLASNQSRA